METTSDKFLNGRLIIQQPKYGYRAGLDPVLLAAAIPNAACTVLDVGCGVGTIGLCALARNPDFAVTGMEIQTDHVHLAALNITVNGFESKMNVYENPLGQSHSKIIKNSYDVVVSNPPFFNYGDQAKNGNSDRAQARHLDMPLESWVQECMKYVKPRGHLILMIRAHQAFDLMASNLKHTGEKNLFPIYSQAGEPAKNVIFSMRKGVKTKGKILPGLVLHHAKNNYHDDTNNILRHAHSIKVV